MRTGCLGGKCYVLPLRPCGCDAAVTRQCHSHAALLGLPGGCLGRSQAALVPISPLPAHDLHPFKNGGCGWQGPCAHGRWLCAQLPVPLPLAGEAGMVVPVTASGSSGWERAGGLFQPHRLVPAPRPRRWHKRGWLCLAPMAVLAAPGQAPVLTRLLSPQVVPESGAWERERHAAQQAGQVCPPTASWLGVPLSPQTSSSPWAELPHGWP